MARRVLVTGAGGFIGSHLVEALVARGDTVRAMVRYNGRGDLGSLAEVPRPVRDAVEVVTGDLTDPFFVRRAVDRCDAVFHLGALIAIPFSYRSPAQVFATNVTGTLNVCQGCLDAGVSRLVHTSTSEVYGTARQVPIPETHPLVGQSPYAASKIGADKCVESFHLSFGLPAATVRPFNTYGPRQSARAVIPTIFTQALTRDRVKLGSRSPTRDLNFVTDTVAGMIRASEAPEAVGRTVNLGTGKEISIGDLARRCIAITGRDVELAVDDARLRPPGSEVERLCADARLAGELLGWAPAVTLDEGLSRVCDYVRDNLGRYRPEEYSV